VEYHGVMIDPIARIRSDKVLAGYAPNVVYVLSGGSAKGFFHLGMIEALQQKGIRPDLVVGTSAGALFGSLFCHFGNVEEVYWRIEEVLRSEEFKAFEKKYLEEKPPGPDGSQWRIKGFLTGLTGKVKKGVRLGKAMVTTAMVSQPDAQSVFGRVFSGMTFQSLKIPFAAVATDLNEGAPAVFTSLPAEEMGNGAKTIPGPEGLMTAVMASSAIPFIFPAVEIEGRAHADGNVMANLPVRQALGLLRGREAFIAAFDVSAPIERRDEDMSAMELALRFLDLSVRSKQGIDRELADVSFRPVDKVYPWSSFADYKTYSALGREYMTGERIAAFEAAYFSKCETRIRGERGFFKRRAATAALRRLSRWIKTGPRLPIT
jgi:NTE family protein